MTDVSMTLEQAIAAQRALREALGLGEERFPMPAFVGMISDELEQLHDAGRTDQEIAEMIEKATGQAIDPNDLLRYYAPPEDRGSWEDEEDN